MERQLQDATEQLRSIRMRQRKLREEGEQQARQRGKGREEVEQLRKDVELSKVIRQGLTHKYTSTTAEISASQKKLTQLTDRMHEKIQEQQRRTKVNE